MSHVISDDADLLVDQLVDDAWFLIASIWYQLTSNEGFLRVRIIVLNRTMSLTINFTILDFYLIKNVRSKFDNNPKYCKSKNNN